MALRYTPLAYICLLGCVLIMKLCNTGLKDGIYYGLWHLYTLIVDGVEQEYKTARGEMNLGTLVKLEIRNGDAYVIESVPAPNAP